MLQSQATNKSNSWRRSEKHINKIPSWKTIFFYKNLKLKLHILADLRRKGRALKLNLEGWINKNTEGRIFNTIRLNHKAQNNHKAFVISLYISTTAQDIKTLVYCLILGKHLGSKDWRKADIELKAINGTKELIHKIKLR